MGLSVLSYVPAIHDPADIYLADSILIAEYLDK